MTNVEANSERTLILAPIGRDAHVAARLLSEAGNTTLICRDLAHLCAELDRGVAFVVLTEEALTRANPEPLSRWIEAQPPWSDIPIVLLTGRDDASGRSLAAQQFQSVLGNVTFLERPFHATTLVSIARAALRSRRRQYAARAMLERHQLLMYEIEHRSKNLLAVIQSIASATWPRGEDLDGFLGRLRALGAAQSLLTKGEKNGAWLHSVAAQALIAFPDRVRIEGPDLLLSANASQSFTLLMHELATNAVKYGALSTKRGTVAVDWSVESAPDGETVRFRWRERGGPPAKSPTRKGFGSKLLTHAIPHCGEPPTFDYSPKGFSYELRTSLKALTSR